MRKVRKVKRPRLVVYLRKMVSDLETDSYALRGIPSDKQREVLDALEKVGDLMYVRVEDGEIRFGVDENKQDQIYSYEFDDDFDDDSYSFSAGEITKKVQETVGNILGRRIRAHFVEETASMGELIWGDNWEEDVALTEEEREMLSY